MNNLNDYISLIEIVAIPLIFALTVPEALRVYIARILSDQAPALRATSINPLHYIDFLGTFVLPVLMFVSTKGSFLIGYPKPAEIDFSLLKNPKRDMRWLILSSSGANFAMAFLWGVLLLVLSRVGLGTDYVNQLCEFGVRFNLLFLAFKLIPIPPLDGGWLLISILPPELAQQFAKVARFGFFIVLGLALIGILQYWIGPVSYVTDAVRRALTYPFFILLS